MTSRKKPFSASLAQADRRFHSLNLLLADYEPIVDLARDEAILDNKQPSSRYGSRDYADNRFYKNLSMPLGPVTPGEAGAGGASEPGASETAPAAPEAQAAPAAPAAPLDPSKYFVLWACCLAVDGASRSLVCDLQRSTFTFIPNVLVEILELCKDRPISAVYEHYQHQHDQQIDEYLQFLISKEYGFLSASPQRFPAMSLAWRSPRTITNCVIDFAAGTEHPLASINEQLSTLFCQAVELRFFYAASLAELSGVLEAFVDSTVRGISVLTGAHPTVDRAALELLLRQHKRVKHVTVHSTAAHDEIVRVDLHTTLRFTSEQVTSEACCGQVSPRYFNCNVEAFTEAVEHNSCLHRKVSIDARGAIKNCPSMAHSYGQIGDTPLLQVVAQDHFQASWKVTKDQISVCQDCEFRYICHDCRAYVADPAQPLSKPARCRYNPYQGRWE
ncbi:MAG: grasp-with-spasm system SPASM domain peptide maturase [Myxococcales bacterium]|nr:grasp-with-spasm system SPASM domain peptide maturase [Myxococcales bacterium]